MTFEEWLNALGQVVSSFAHWVGDTATYLMSNYLIITIFGMSAFIFLFGIIYSLIKDAREFWGTPKDKKNID